MNQESEIIPLWQEDDANKQLPNHRIKLQSHFHVMPRVRKIAWLETELCVRIDNGEEVKDLIKAIEQLQSNRVDDEQIIIGYGKSASASLFDQMLTGLMVACVFFLICFGSSILCNGKQTAFCKDARSIPLMLNNYLFREITPESKRPPILPANP